jgi:HEAT repeat protein
MSINRLTRELRDMNPETRSKAAMNLAAMGASETLPSIISAFKKDANENVRSVMAEALASFSDYNDAVFALLTARKEDESELVRVSAEWALKEIAKKRDFSTVDELLESINEE